MSHREAGAAAVDAITGDGGVVDVLGRAIALLGHRAPFAAEAERLRASADELTDCARELRGSAERIDPDPERLAEVRDRRLRLRELRRKYGEDLAAVLAYAAETGARLAELESHDERVARLERDRAASEDRVRRAASEVRAAREAAAPRLAAAVQERLAALAMPRARLEITVGAADAGPAGEVDDGSAVQFLIAANPGAAPAPLQKAASGGELARTMLALRLALLETGESRSGRGPWTLVFDEVDAGIGGATAAAVGRALAALSVDRQVLVVTHLAQVAAAAGTHVLVAKHDDGVTTTTTVGVLDDEARLQELSRMLAGRPDSSAAREHAQELLAAARGSMPGVPGRLGHRGAGRPPTGQGAGVALLAGSSSSILVALPPANALLAGSSSSILVALPPAEVGCDSVAKHIFVTGGVASSLGKGLTAASLGRLLKQRGLRVTMQKLDPYLNVDPGR